MIGASCDIALSRMNTGLERERVNATKGTTRKAGHLGHVTSCRSCTGTFVLAGVREITEESRQHVRAEIDGEFGADMRDRIARPYAFHVQ